MQRFLLTLLSVLLLGSSASALTSKEVLDQVAKYQPTDIPNTCTINSQLFSIWYLTQKFPGGEVAQVIGVQDRLSSPAINHAVVLFSLEGTYYLWDQILGAMPLKTGNLQNPKALNDLMDQTYNRAAKRAIKGSREFRRPVPVQVTGNKYDWIQNKLSRNFSTVQIDIKTKKKSVQALVWFDREFVYVFELETGTSMGTLSTNREEDLSTLVKKQFGQQSTVSYR